MKFSEFWGLVRSDFKRYQEYWSYGTSLFTNIKLILMPAMVAVTLYRISNFFYRNGWKSISWIIWAFNITLTGAEILPNATIGRGFLLGHPVGTIISGKIGNNVTSYGQTGLGGGLDDKDVGAGKGLPVVEDNAIIGVRSIILGPVVIGEGAVISPGAFVSKDVPAGATAIGNPCRILKRAEPPK